MSSTLEQHPWLATALVIAVSIIFIIAASINVTWFLLALRKRRERGRQCTCYLCGERQGTRKLWGFDVCAGCLLTYEALLYYAVVQDNPNAREVLQLAGKKLNILSIPTVTYSGRTHWRTNKEGKS